MYRFGVRVYFEVDGKVLYQAGKIETNVESYYENNDPRDWHPDLIGKEGIEMQQFAWDEYENEFSTQKLARIDTETRQPQFEDWPEPDPDEVSPDPPKSPLEERLERAEAENAENRNSIMELTMLLAAGV